MKLHSGFILVVFHLVFSLYVKPQQTRVDSLLSVLHKGKIHDTTRATIYVTLTEELAFSNPDTVIPLCNAAIHIIGTLSDKIKHADNVQIVLATALNNIGFIHQHQGNTDSAVIYYMRSMEVRKANGDKPGMSSAYNNIGSVYLDLGKINKAISYFKKSLNLRREIKDQAGVAQSLHNIGAIYDYQGQIQKALEYYLQALAIREKIKDERGISVSLNNIGTLYDYQGETDKALTYYRRSLKIRRKLNDKTGISISLNNIGSVYDNKGEKQKALQYYRQAMVLCAEVQEEMRMATAMNNIGYVYQTLGETDSALFYFNHALEVRERINDKKGLAMTQNSLASLYLEKKQYNIAQQYALASMQKSRELGFPESIRDAAHTLYEGYKAVNKAGPALSYFELYVRMKDSIRNEETEKSAIQQEAKYKYEKAQAIRDKEHEKKLALSAEQEEKQKIISYTAFGGLLLISLFLFFVFNRLKLTRRQKREIENQKKEIETTHHRLSEQHKEIRDSISYAKRIQEAILPDSRKINQALPDAFIFYLPKDVVAGDFYWIETMDDNTVYVAAADCTGHGVPGAMVSVVCSNALSKALREEGIRETGKLLDRTRELVIAQFANSGEEVKDGMDISLASLELKMKNEELKMDGEKSEMTSTVELEMKNEELKIDDEKSEMTSTVELEMKNEELKMDDEKSAITSTSSHKPALPPDTHQTSNNKPQTHPMELSVKKEELKMSNAQPANRNSQFETVLRWSGANNPLWVVRGNEIIEIKANKQPVGVSPNPSPFTTHTLPLQSGDCVYLFTDGYQDQFGGEKGKKFKASNLKLALSVIHHLPMEEQKEMLHQKFSDWKGTLEQVDDVCIIGIRIP